MKLKNLILGTMCFATLAVACNKAPQVVVPGVDDQDEIELPIVNEPGSGKTTMVLYVPENTHANGLYAIGTINDWKHNQDGFKFTKVEGDDTGRWYQITLDYAADMGVKVCAVPSKPNLAGWSYQWGKNIDDNDPDPEVKEDNVIVLGGTVEIQLENQGQPKAINFADGGVAYIQVKAWAADPNIKEQPATAIAFKHPWNGGEWVYKDAVAKGNGVFELEDYFGNNGFNVKDENNGEAWYPTDSEFVTIYEGAATGDKVTVRFTSTAGSSEGKLEVILIEKGQLPEVQPVIVTVRAKWPTQWTGTPTAWVWPTGGEGSEAVLEKDGDFYKYTTPEAVAGLNIIFKDGTGWNGDTHQTVNVEGIVKNTDYEIVYSEKGKATVNEIK